MTEALDRSSLVSTHKEFYIEVPIFAQTSAPLGFIWLPILYFKLLFVHPLLGLDWSLFVTRDRFGPFWQHSRSALGKCLPQGVVPLLGSSTSLGSRPLTNQSSFSHSVACSSVGVTESSPGIPWEYERPGQVRNINGLAEKGLLSPPPPRAAYNCRDPSSIPRKYRCAHGLLP